MTTRKIINKNFTQLYYCENDRFNNEFSQLERGRLYKKKRNKRMGDAPVQMIQTKIKII